MIYYSLFIYFNVSIIFWFKLSVLQSFENVSEMALPFFSSIFLILFLLLSALFFFYFYFSIIVERTTTLYNVIEQYCRPVTPFHNYTKRKKKNKANKSKNKIKKIELKKGRDIPEMFSKDCKTLSLNQNIIITLK